MKCNSLGSVLDILHYVNARIDKLQSVTEAYAMAGKSFEDYKGDLFAIGELQMLRNEIEQALDEMSTCEFQEEK